MPQTTLISKIYVFQLVSTIILVIILVTINGVNYFTFSNDKFPRSKQHLEQTKNTFVGNGASIGANATILPGIFIGENSMVGAGTVLTKSVPPNSLVYGNPGKIMKYFDLDEDDG